MRSVRIAPGEYYHLFNRGAGKQIIFKDRADRVRFLFLVIFFQSDLNFPNLGRDIKQFLNFGQHSVLTKEGQSKAHEVIIRRSVELISFSLMPNHFHILVKEIEEDGIAVYMQRVLNSYTKYFNTKYEKSGHLFQGPYGAVHVEDNEQILYLSAYIHRNPRELKEWFGKEDLYEWSSYSDFLRENRFGDLLMPDIITGQFKNKDKYKEFVATNTSKLLESELGGVFIDLY